MADKTWTATDLELGKLTIHRTPTELRVERRYKFKDSNGDILSQIVGGRLLVEEKFSEIPASIPAALQTIDAWTKQQALDQEGMS